MGSALPKQLLMLGNRPVLVHTLLPFLAHPAIRQIVIAVPADHLETIREVLQQYIGARQRRRILVTVGGRSRQDSVLCGLRAMPADIDDILVHDAARPLVTSRLISRCLAALRSSGTCLAAVPVKDTLKKVQADRVVTTVDRQMLWQAQTPQGARRKLLEKGYDCATAAGFLATDEAALLEHAGIGVQVVPGDEINIKLTTPGDLVLARRLMQELPPLRIGHGFDAHRLEAGRPLILGGVPIDFTHGLKAHSDGDVLAHALMDALLGALALGDIGHLFPDTDPTYHNADSLQLLTQVMTLVWEHDMELVNADITVVCQQPRLAPYLDRMQRQVGAACGVPPGQISIKATTTEKMGYTGRGEGISVHAVVLVQRGARLRADHSPDRVG